MKPFAKPGSQDEAFSPSPSAASSKNWDFPKSSPQTPPLSAPSFLLGGGGGKRFDFSSKPSPPAAPVVQPVAVAGRPIHAAFSRASWSEPSVNSDAAPAPQQRRSFPATTTTTTTALTTAKPADAFSKRPRVQQPQPPLPPPLESSPDPQPRPAQRSLVVAKPAAHHLYQHDEPFLEVSNVIQTQTRKIKELETQLREHGFLNEQLRAKLEAGQESSKQSSGEISDLTQQLARAEKSLEHRDNDVAVLKIQISSLEHDRARMMAENVSLSKAMQEEKKQFVHELKRSSDVILVMQGVRAGKTPAPVAEQTSNGELEKQLEEAESALSHYDRCYQVVLQVVEQCEGCAEKLAQLQSEQDAVVEDAAAVMEDEQTKDQAAEGT